MDEELRRYIRGELRSIRIELKKRYDVIVAKNDLNAISAAVLDKQAREFYVPVGIALADRTQQEKSPTNLEDAVIQPELEKLNQLVTDYSNNCIRKLINGRKPRTISKNMDYYPGGQRYCVNQEEVNEAHFFNESLYKDAKDSQKLAILAFSCGIELCDEELLRNYSQKDFNRPYSETTSGLLGILCEKLWGEIESYYAFTTHEKIVRITERGENETNEWGRFYDNVMKGVKIEE